VIGGSKDGSPAGSGQAANNELAQWFEEAFWGECRLLKGTLSVMVYFN
jgi:hypothetical protein